MAATARRAAARTILYGVGAFMLLTVVVWMRNVFGVVVVLAWGLALVTMARRRMANALRFLSACWPSRSRSTRCMTSACCSWSTDRPTRRPWPALPAAGVVLGGDVDADERRDARVDVWSTRGRLAANRSMLLLALTTSLSAFLLFSVQPLIANRSSRGSAARARCGPVPGVLPVAADGRLRIQRLDDAAAPPAEPGRAALGCWR
jgi:hypothetical protein